MRTRRILALLPLLLAACAPARAPGEAGERVVAAASSKVELTETLEEDLPLLEDPAANETFVQLGFSTLAAAAAQAGAAGGEPPASEPTDDTPADAQDDQAPGAGVPEAGGFREGQYVYWDGGEGTIEHLMIDGVLGVEGSPFAIAATEAEPAASIRIHEGGEPTEFTVGKRVADLSAEPIEQEPEA